MTTITRSREEKEPITNLLGAFSINKVKSVSGAVRYAVVLQPSSPKLKKELYISIRGRYVDVEAQLNLVEKYILRNALYSVTSHIPHTELMIRSVRVNA
jgi:hypothetical protein